MSLSSALEESAIATVDGARSVACSPVPLKLEALESRPNGILLSHGDVTLITATVVVIFGSHRLVCGRSSSLVLCEPISQITKADIIRTEVDSASIL